MIITFSLFDLIALGALALFGITVYFFSRSGNDLAPNNPKAVLAARMAAGETRRPLAVCAGDSITRGSVSVDYVSMLASRLPDWDFVNAGANGELAFNLAGRMDDIVALDPDAVTILVGTNDVNATFGFQAAVGYMAVKRLPERPNAYFFRENLVGIVRTLKRETRARIALFSIPPIGEEPGHYAYLRTEDYAMIIRNIATEERVEYLPLRERICAYIEGLPAAQSGPPISAHAGPPVAAHAGPPVAAHARPLPFREIGRAQLRAGRMQRYLGKSLDEISASNRFHILVDGIHLNTHGAAIAADLAEAFLSAHG